MSARAASAGSVSDLDLEFPPKPEYVGLARHVVAAVARMHEVGEEVVDDLKLAVSEACTNAVTANAGAGGAPVHVVAALGGQALVVEVEQRGPRLDPALLERDAQLDSEGFSFEHGLSMPMIRGLVDELAIEPREEGGVLRMRLLVPPAPHAAP